jgi:Copper type II ascorbate-dependent monooxygenase, C-terminal domain
MRLIKLASMLCLLFAVSAAGAADYYRTIRPIIETRCLHCHSGSGVSFAFGDVDTAYAFHSAMANAVSTKRMPPWMAAPGYQQYQHSLALTDTEIAAFSAWAKADFPLGDKKSYKPTPLHGLDQFKADLSIDVSGSAGFLPDQKQRDDYRCFIADWPEKTAKYVRGIELSPGNLRIAHHAILYVVESQYVAALRAMDAAESGAGYRCFGGPLPDRFGDPAQANAFDKRFPGAIKGIQEHQFWLSHWAPGMTGYTLPPETGLLVKPKSVLIVQMHYFTGFATNQSDRGTRIGFQLANSVQKPAFNWPLTNQQWLYASKNQSLVVPAQGKASVTTEANLAGLDIYLSALSGVPKSRISGLEVHSANLHMHLIGASGAVTLIGPKQRQTLLKVPRYEFGWQRDFVFTQPKIIPSDELGRWKIKVDCTFANPNQEPVYGGYGSNQEMCYNFSLISISRKK